MGKIVKLTENELKYMITESVKKILKESPYRGGWDRSGSVPRDGMTGGSWGSKRVYGTYWVDIDRLIELIDDETYSDELYKKLESIGEELYFEVEADYGYDDSVGMPEGIYDIEVDYSPCIKAVKDLSLFRGDEISELKKAIMHIASEVEENDGDGVDWR